MPPTLEKLALALTNLRHAARELDCLDLDASDPVSRFGDRVADLLISGDALFDRLIDDVSLPAECSTATVTVH